MSGDSSASEGLAARLLAGPWAVEFQRVGDRFAHRIVRARDGFVLAESVEGHADDPWPASPTLQELHHEARGDGPGVVLLVGMAGVCHWSLSVEVRRAGQHGPGEAPQEIVFDAACRVAQPPDWLGSTYRMSAWDPPEVSPAGFALNPLDQQVGMLARGAEPDGMNEWRCGPVPRSENKSWPCTLRWRYRWLARIDG